MSDHIPTHQQERPRVAIVGAGVIGLSCAVELADRGADVTIYEQGQPGRGASWAAAGMLAPAFEAAAEPGVHPDLFHLCMESARQWPDFAARLTQRSGNDVGYVAGPSLAVAMTEQQADHLRAVATQLSTSGVPYEVLSKQQLLQTEPNLSGDVNMGLALPTDGHVDNRKAVEALLSICRRDPHIELEVESEQLDLTQLAPRYDQVICAAGWQSAKLIEQARGIVPIGGHMFSVAWWSGAPRHTVRSGHIYIVPQSDRVIVGATMEPNTVRQLPDDALIDSLRRQASTICPVLADRPDLETWAGTRPGSPDHAPLLGRVGSSNIVLASGHHRNGILLAPVTASAIADLVFGDEVSDLISAFQPGRLIENHV